MHDSIIRWGLIGCGDVACRKGGPALYQADRSELVAVTSRTLARAKAFVAKQPISQFQETVPTVAADVDTLLADPRINAVYIATPPDSHAELTARAAQAGKQVLCEKPMARTVDECRAMLQACEAARVSLVIAYYRRTFPVYEKLRELLRRGAIGQPLHALVESFGTPPNLQVPRPWRVDPAIAGGGYLMDVGTHRLDLLVDLFGRPTFVAGRAITQTIAANVDDAATLHLEFSSTGALRNSDIAESNAELPSAEFASDESKSPVLATVVLHWNSAIGRDRFEVIGSAGTLSTDSLSGAGELVLQTRSERRVWQLPAPDPTHLRLVAATERHWLDGEPNPAVGSEAIVTNEIVRDVCS